jgi:DedD protein
MPLPSFLQRLRPRAASGAEAAPLSGSDVEAARVRARRRLIGMAVLVGAGVIGFPWLFETQPRPMSSDIQIVQAGSAEATSAGATPVASSPSVRGVAGKVAVAGVVAPVVPVVAEQIGKVSAPEPEEVIESAPPRPAPSPVKDKPKDAAKPASKPVVKEAHKEPAKPVAKDSTKSTGKEKDAPKQASKEASKPSAKSTDKSADKTSDKASDKTPTRYVVQFGAFADAGSAQAARMKVERLGLKTYAQQVDTPAGKRIRVRLGPFTDKSEADKAMAAVRKAGLTGAVLTL